MADDYLRLLSNSSWSLELDQMESYGAINSAYEQLSSSPSNQETFDLEDNQGVDNRGVDNQGVDRRISGPQPRQATLDTAFLGKTRRFNDLSCLEIIFLSISSSGLLACLILTSIKLVHYTGDDFTFGILIIVNTVFCCYYILNGIFRERPYELAIFVIATAIVVIYVIVNFSMTKGLTDTVRLIRFIFALIFAPFLVIVGCILTKKYNTTSGNLIFRTVGAKPWLQSCCKLTFCTSSVIKLNFQIAVSMVVLILRKGPEIHQLEKIVLGVGLPITVLCLVLGFAAMRFENKKVTWLFFLLSCVEPCYVMYKIYEEKENPSPTVALSAVTYTCAAISLVVRIVVIILMVLVYRNFGKGLKEMMEAVTKPGQRSNTGESAEASNQV